MYCEGESIILGLGGEDRSEELEVSLCTFDLLQGMAITLPLGPFIPYNIEPKLKHSSLRC